MTRLMMHWHLVQAADGKRRLDMTWESAHARIMAGQSRPQSQPRLRDK